MNAPRDRAYLALKRLLANGPLMAVPKRPSDQQLLAAMAASQFEARRTYGESDVNEKLQDWLATFCEPFGVDHVTVRRMLVDYRLLSRTTSGSTYQVNPERIADADGVKAIDPVQVLAEIREERESRKRQRAA